MKKLLLFFFALLTSVSGAWAETVTWTPGLSFNESTTGNYSTGWFTVVSPINGTLNSFTVNLGTGDGAGIFRTDAYLAISRNLKSSTTGFSASDFVAISNESCTTTGSKITLTFNSDAVLNGGSTYYFYWVTESSGVYTTVNQRYYVVSSTQMSVGSVGSTSASSASYAMPFSATMTIADNKYYRIKALYPDGICYLYSNESNEDKIWKNTSAPSVTALRYVWKATLSTGLILQNVGSSRYIPKLTTGSKTGADVDYLTATTTDDAEKFSLEDNNPGAQNQPGFIALKSTTAASDVWLNTATSGNAWVGSHDANPNKSGQFLFYQVKKVTFSMPVAVNGGDAVSTIYVAVDGSDLFTLPAGYLYSVDGAAEVSNTLAASAIAAAGTSDMNITVNPGATTFNLKFQGETIRTMDVSRESVLGTAALPTESWNHACCEYSFEPSTIDSETETVDVTMTWNVGDLTFSSDYASATWYHMSLHNKWAKYDASVNGTSNGHPLYTDINQVNYDVAGYAGMWAFVGNPLDGVYLYNRETGDDKVLGWTTPPRMQSISEGSSKKFIFGKKSDTEFTLCYSGFYVNDFKNEGELKFWNDGGGATADGSAIIVEDISLYELSLIELDEYASEHAEGEYFGLKPSSVTSLRNSIKAEKASFNSTAASDAHDAIQALWPGTDNANVNYPPTGQYWIRSNGRDPYRYMQINDAGTPVNTLSKAGVGNVVTLTALANHKYKIQMQGLYLDAPTYSGDFLDMTASNEGAEFDTEVASLRVVGFKSGNAWNFIHPRNSGTYGLMCYLGPSTDNASGWVVEDATSVSISLNSDGAGTPTYYATLCLPFDATISGADAYTLAQSGSWLVPTAVTDNEVPAGTPVLLKGSSNTATATINKGDAFNSGSPLECALTGTYTAKTIAGSTDYVLGIYDGVVGFYHWDSNNLGANRAYFDTPETPTPGVKGFIVNWGDETGIENLNVNDNLNKGESIYNLAGQRVQKAQKGIYIVNGKKVVIK